MAKRFYPKVVFIILNWNNWKDTVECLESVSCVDYPNFDVVVVDNGSNNDSVNQIKKIFDSVTLIEINENLGFAGGCNVGMKYAVKKGDDIIFLLNSDTIIEKDALNILVEVAEKHPKVGLLSPKIYFYNRDPENRKIWFGGSKLNSLLGRTVMLGYGKVDRGQYDKEKLVDFISGCAMVIKAEVFNKIGFFDTDYFNIFEDADYCVRAKNAGYDCIYVPKAVVHHKESMSIGSIYSPLSVYFQIRNRLLFIKKNVKKKWLPFSVIAVLLSFFKRIFQLILKRKLLSLRAFKFAIYDFFTLNFNKGSLSQLLQKSGY